LDDHGLAVVSEAMPSSETKRLLFVDSEELDMEVVASGAQRAALADPPKPSLSKVRSTLTPFSDELL
jgi:hypothetical protein